MRRRRKPRKNRKRLAYGLIAATFILVCFLTYFFLHQTHDNQLSQPRAAIVDQLSFRNETANQTFVNASKKILENANFALDYYRGEEINVTFYKCLFTRGYSLIVFRVHSAIIEELDSLSLFTSEHYDPDNIPSAYYEDIRKNRIVQAYFTEGDPINYFAISPGFVEEYGNFQNAVIIIMGCDGLKNNKMAEAFRREGAGVCIGWDGLVSTPHTDHATVCLLQNLAQGNTVEAAVEKTMREIGPDETYLLNQGYSSKLKHYPSAAGNYTIQTRALLHTVLMGTIHKEFVSGLRRRNIHCIYILKRSRL
jgi:hypothetical protein